MDLFKIYFLIFILQTLCSIVEGGKDGKIALHMLKTCRHYDSECCENVKQMVKESSAEEEDGKKFAHMSTKELKQIIKEDKAQIKELLRHEDCEEEFNEAKEKHQKNKEKKKMKKKEKKRKKKEKRQQEMEERNQQKENHRNKPRRNQSRRNNRTNRRKQNRGGRTRQRNNYHQNRRKRGHGRRNRRNG